jgi:hypothetical protein
MVGINFNLLWQATLILFKITGITDGYTLY